jgi:ferric-dicitrate binding protein FerR (iron transport regulator)
MFPDHDRLTYLFRRYTEDNASAEEVEELFTYIRRSEHLAPLKAQIMEIFQQARTDERFDHLRWDVMFASITGVQEAGMAMQETPVKRIFPWVRAAAAAAAILVLSASAYFFFFRQQRAPGKIAVAVKQDNNDVAAPSKVKATLTLSNGRMIVIDSITHGTVVTQGNAKITKLSNGQIAYHAIAGNAVEMVYNTLTLPRGSRTITITLADGTKVWLNAASSLRYPAAFAGRERRVAITGEAYFEVAPDAGKPFIVEKGDVAVKVLGTHFNVNAYDDEAEMKVTLLEGSVQVTKGSAGSSERYPLLLRPGQQASINADGKIDLSSKVDTEEVMAWKNGKFRFNVTDIETVMRQISRWYDVDITYRGTVTTHFWGSISRDVNVSQVLSMLEQTGTVKFQIEDKQVTVMPK